MDMAGVFLIGGVVVLVVIVAVLIAVVMNMDRGRDK